MDVLQLSFPVAHSYLQTEFTCCTFSFLCFVVPLIIRGHINSYNFCKRNDHNEYSDGFSDALEYLNLILCNFSIYECPM